MEKGKKYFDIVYKKNNVERLAIHGGENKQEEFVIGEHLHYLSHDLGDGIKQLDIELSKIDCNPPPDYLMLDYIRRLHQEKKKSKIDPLPFANFMHQKLYYPVRTHHGVSWEKLMEYEKRGASKIDPVSAKNEKTTSRLVFDWRRITFSSGDRSPHQKRYCKLKTHFLTKKEREGHQKYTHVSPYLSISPLHQKNNLRSVHFMQSFATPLTIKHAAFFLYAKSTGDLSPALIGTAKINLEKFVNILPDERVAVEIPVVDYLCDQSQRNDTRTVMRAVVSVTDAFTACELAIRASIRSANFEHFSNSTDSPFIKLSPKGILIQINNIANVRKRNFIGDETYELHMQMHQFYDNQKKYQASLINEETDVSRKILTGDEREIRETGEETLLYSLQERAISSPLAHQCLDSIAAYEGSDAIFYNGEQSREDSFSANPSNFSSKFDKPKRYEIIPSKKSRQIIHKETVSSNSLKLELWEYLMPDSPHQKKWRRLIGTANLPSTSPVVERDATHFLQSERSLYMSPFEFFDAEGAKIGEIDALLWRDVGRNTNALVEKERRRTVAREKRREDAWLLSLPSVWKIPAYDLYEINLLSAFKVLRTPSRHSIKYLIRLYQKMLSHQFLISRDGRIMRTFASLLESLPEPMEILARERSRQRYEARRRYLMEGPSNRDGEHLGEQLSGDLARDGEDDILFADPSPHDIALKHINFFETRLDQFSTHIMKITSKFYNLQNQPFPSVSL